MAAPTAPTLITLSTEALKKAGYASPSTLTGVMTLTRVQDEFFEEIKNDIWNLTKKLKSLQTTGITITTPGIPQYTNPSDFSSDMVMTLMTGLVTGTAQAGGATSITLAAADTTTDNVGEEIMIYSGTGSGQARFCSAYDSGTKVATISPAWTVNPESGSKYMIIDRKERLIPGPVWDYNKKPNLPSKGEPTHWYPVGDEDYGEFILSPTPYRTNADTTPYGIEQRYYANLMTLDLAGTLMATIYRRWRSIFIQGGYAKALHKDDSEKNIQMSNYNSSLLSLVARETYGMDMSNLQRSVED